jgi:membrane-associated phospholipid phosphatase
MRPDLTATVALVPTAIALCWCWGIRPNADVLKYLLMAIITLLGGAIPAVLLYFAIQRFCRNPGKPGALPRLIAAFAQNAALLAAVCWVYSHLKAGVLLGNNVDGWLYEVDVWLCGGSEPWTLLRDWIPAFFAGPLYVVYMAFLPVLLAAVFLLAMFGRTRTAGELMCALVLGYYLGALGYHVLPSYGPAFVVLSASPDELSPGVASIQDLILGCVQMVQVDPKGAEIQPWAYVAAFPSLHFSHVLIATWYLRRNRWACAAMVIFAALTAISTVYFGWHYLMDWLGGLFVAVAAVSLTELWSLACRKQVGAEATETSIDAGARALLLACDRLTAWSETTGEGLLKPCQEQLPQPWLVIESQPYCLTPLRVERFTQISWGQCTNRPQSISLEDSAPDPAIPGDSACPGDELG